MWFRRRKPVTHAAALWTLVVLGAVAFAALAGYLAVLSRLENGAPVVALKGGGQERLPTLFGTITSIETAGTLRVESKQGFSIVAVDEGTKIASLGGGALDLGSLKPGMRVTATGKDLGEGRMLAEAVVVITRQVSETRPATLLQAPQDWKDWAKMPALIGWSSGSKYLAAVRGFDLKTPAVSVELYDREGELVERIELDVPGYKHLKKLNAFMTPEDAERTLRELGIYAAADGSGEGPLWQLVVRENPRKVEFVRKDGD